MENQANLWVNRYQKNLKINSQLDFSRNFYISFKDKDQCSLEMFKFQSIQSINGADAIQFYTDKRKNLFQSLDQNQIINCMHYFPLSKEKYLIQAKLQVEKDNEKRQQIWQAFSIEQKEQYLTKQPDQLKQQNNDQYNIQERENVSENFQVMQLIPENIYLTILQMPQVYADARNPVFESEFKPYKKEKKMHIYKQDNEWHIKEINP